MSCQLLREREIKYFSTLMNNSLGRGKGPAEIGISMGHNGERKEITALVSGIISSGMPDETLGRLCISASTFPRQVPCRLSNSPLIFLVWSFSSSWKY